MNFTLGYSLLVLLFVWVIALTVLYARFYLFYSKISRGSKKDSLLKLLEDVIGREQANLAHIKTNSEQIKKLEEKSLLNIQKVGLLRFNPFNDTGGDHSFILCLLDAHDTGVIISGLHTRSGTRWYAKKVTRGKGVEHALSKDEEKALQSATYFN